MNLFETALLRYLKPDILAIIQKKKIGIGGAGGLGSNLAAILLRSGFRHFEILDKDTVEASNLNRQDYTLTDIGKQKTECLKERLLAINPSAEIILHSRTWDTQSAGSFFNTTEIIAEAFDDAETKKKFVEYYAPRTAYIVSGNGMAGLDTKTSATSVRRAGNIFIAGDGITSIDDEHPPLAPRVLQCAAKMAEIILHITLGINIK